MTGMLPGVEPVLKWANVAFLAAFTFELAVKLCAKVPRNFFKDQALAPERLLSFLFSLFFWFFRPFRGFVSYG